MAIRILDCTLRDGGHINASNFGKNVINGITHKLFLSGVDYLEVGFLRSDIECSSEDVAIFSSISQAERSIPSFDGSSRLVLMAQEDQFDIDRLEPCSKESRFKTIRVSFHDFDMESGLDFCKKVKERGYDVCINPINTPGYSDAALITLIGRINEIRPFAFTIVDTFGAMQPQDLRRIYYLVENNLSKDIAIGVHLHENLSLSFALAQEFAAIVRPSRVVIIDGSLNGMGRDPGNLSIELMMDFLNTNNGAAYTVPEALEAIDEYIVPIRKKNPWGYSITYWLSARHKVHRTYAEFLMQKGKLTIADINCILDMIAKEKMTCYDGAYIERLYRQFMRVPVESNAGLAAIKNEIAGKSVCVIAPGASLRNTKRRNTVLKTLPVDLTIAMNFCDKAIPCDFYFYTNQKRFNNDYLYVEKRRTILSSNVRKNAEGVNTVLPFALLSMHNGVYSDSSLLMVLNMLSCSGCCKVFLFGFDGFGNEINFYKPGYERSQNYDAHNEDIARLLPDYRRKLSIEFASQSKYEQFCVGGEEKNMGKEMSDERIYNNGGGYSIDKNVYS